ncbi:MAG: L-threonylcarbamoyladenylate synthase [Actinomycetota bacterium]
MTDIDAAVGALDCGEVIVLPTETVYGLAARADLEEAVGKIFELKGRSRDQVLQILLPDATSLASWAGPNDAASDLAARFWPGPLTLVVAARASVPSFLTAAGTVGLRVPSHRVALDVLERSGPLAATSANVAGEQPLADVTHLRATFGDRVSVYIDVGRIEGDASTVVDVTGADPVVLREGAIAFADVTSALSRVQFEPE